MDFTNDGCSTPYSVKFNSRDLTIYLTTEVGEEIATPHKCGKCGKDLKYSVLFQEILTEIVADGFESIELNSDTGKIIQKKVADFKLNGKPLCSKCTEFFYINVQKMFDEDI